MANIPDWSFVERALKGDRSLPDGRIESTDVHDWQALLDELDARDWRLTAPDGTALANDARSAAALLREDAPVTIAVWPTPELQINLFVNGVDEILFDFDSDELDDAEDLAALCTFVEALGRSTGKPVKLSHEGARELVFLTYDPATRAFATIDLFDRS